MAGSRYVPGGGVRAEGLPTFPMIMGFPTSSTYTGRSRLGGLGASEARRLRNFKQATATSSANFASSTAIVVLLPTDSSFQGICADDSDDSGTSDAFPVESVDSISSFERARSAAVARFADWQPWRAAQLMSR